MYGQGGGHMIREHCPPATAALLATQGGNTAVAVAAMNGHFDAVRVLLEAGSCTSTQSKVRCVLA